MKTSFYLDFSSTNSLSYFKEVIKAKKPIGLKGLTLQEQENTPDGCVGIVVVRPQVFVSADKIPHPPKAGRRAEFCQFSR